MVEVPIALAVTFLTLFGGGMLSWAAYVTKQLLEHARIIAVVKDRTDNMTIAFASKAAHESDPA